MGATDRVAGVFRRAVSGVRSALPGAAEDGPTDPTPLTGSDVTSPSEEGSPGSRTRAPSSGGATNDPATSTKATAAKKPAKKKPAKKAPAKKAPATSAGPTRTAPKDGPAQQSPADTESAERAPATGAPTRKAPAKKLSAKKAPATKSSATRAPAGKAPERSAPAAAEAGTTDVAGPRSTPAPPAVWSDAELAGFRSALSDEISRLREELDMGEADLAVLIADSGDGAGDDQADAGAKEAPKVKF